MNNVLVKCIISIAIPVRTHHRSRPKVLSLLRAYVDGIPLGPNSIDGAAPFDEAQLFQLALLDWTGSEGDHTVVREHMPVPNQRSTDGNSTLDHLDVDYARFLTLTH